MSGHVKNSTRPSRDAVAKSQRGTEESPFIKWLLIFVAFLFTATFLLLPLINVFAQALGKGWAAYQRALTDPDTLSARYYQPDELHLNSEGAQLFTSALATFLPRTVEHEHLASPN